jgi:drug/metabolite transporter superfamily protein YnfA
MAETEDPTAGQATAARMRASGRADQRPRAGFGRVEQRPRRKHYRGAVRGGSHRGLVLAEFLVCVLLIGAQAFMFPVGVGYSKSLVKPFTRLSATMLLFFVLALMTTSEKSGRFAAALGGLVVVAMLMSAVGTGTINLGTHLLTAQPAPSSGEQA